MIFKVILSHDYLICVIFYTHCIFYKHQTCTKDISSHCVLLKLSFVCKIT